VIDFSILVLDDDELWVALHERRLEQAGFICHSTQDAKEAIKIAKTNPTVKFALIDEILYVTPTSETEEQRELQQWQGTGVIREICAQRSDIQIIVVTAAPVFLSDGDNQLFRRETAKLRRQKGVIDVIHKSDIKEDPDGSYDWLINLLNQPNVSANTSVVTPKVLIGLGFTSDERQAMAEQMNMPKKQYLSIAPLLEKGKSEKAKLKILDNFWERAKEKSVLLEMPGSKKLDPLSGIKAESSAFQILACLAKKTELQTPVIICEQDYKCSPRKSKPQVDDIPEHDPSSVRDYTYENGVQFEGGTSKNSPLKVAIHRLSRQLSKFNVGPAGKLFMYKPEDKGYHPCFELGIVLYTIKNR
jgi:CheY-like chemotaxis protein